MRDAAIVDAAMLRSWWNDGAVLAHAGFPDGLGLSLEDVVKNIQAYSMAGKALFIIEIAGIPVGETNYRLINDATAECGWKICAADWQNRGYGTRIIRLLLRALFSEIKTPSGGTIQKAVWDTNLLNARVQLVYERKIGARKTGVHPGAFQDARGDWQTSVSYAMGREDFLALNS